MYLFFDDEQNYVPNYEIIKLCLYIKNYSGVRLVFPSPGNIFHTNIWVLC